jgi:hypothetical protein
MNSTTRQLQDAYKGDAVGEGKEGDVCTVKGAAYSAYFGSNDLLQDRASAHLPRVHDGTGDSGFHRPGFRVSDAPLSDELQQAYEDYE